MADHRHERGTNARLFNPFRARATVVAAPLAVLATVSAVTLGVLGAQHPAPADVADPAATAAAVDESTAIAEEFAAPARRESLSRSLSRSDAHKGRDAPEESALEKVLDPAAVRTAIAGADDQQYTTADLNLWDEPGKRADQTGEIEAGKKVVVTGRSLYGRVEVISGKSNTRWVTVGYLSEEKPAGIGAGLSDEPCPDPGVESGLTANAVFVYRSVCHAFPQITTYGGYDSHGEHASGRALDIMTSDPALLTAIGDFLRVHAAELHLYDVIRLQQIWTPERGAEGWRFMSDRGSPTANHYDHVHVSTY